MSTLFTLRSDLIFLGVDEGGKEETLRFLANQLHEKGIVKETYANAIIEREKNYATGIPLEKIGVAIPHTDAIHVNEPAIAVAILEKPETFTVMGSPDDQVSVQAIFMLAIKQPSEQLTMLSSLMGFFQQSDVIEKFMKMDSTEEMRALLEKELQAP
ncbi:PTS sugar transporter subunit IIA [Brevibacillus daliensis]|uniref:PTS sugar transporter subunit IIA n=1 Tax=Brevibacillus daliensis TaxID=2892995 RepID=UPI001E2A42A7|nr:PTS sugar transporter subunit IIA [Brevibacillus daliensis]